MTGRRPVASGADAADELPELGYAELFGVTIEEIAQLGELEQEAEDGSRTLRSWRSRHRGICSGHPVPDNETLSALARAASKRWMSARREARDDGNEKASASAEGWWQLVQDLGHLKAPPLKAEVASDVSHTRERLKDMASGGGSFQGLDRESRMDLTSALRDRLQTLLRWQAELGEIGVTDPETGLPGELVERHRTSTHPVLGDVPASVREARARAWLESSPEERELAAAASGRSGFYGEAEAKLALATSELPRVLVTSFLAQVIESGSDVGAAVAGAWADGGLRDLLGEWLDTQ